MKKYFLGFFALTLAFTLSSFTAPKESGLVYNWFRASTQAYITSTSSPDAPAGECNNEGSGCLEGFQDSAVDPDYPGGTPAVTYKQ